MAINSKTVPFTEDYKNECFNAWFLAKCPGARSVAEWAPLAPDGRRPSVDTITNWMNDYGWKLRAADLNAKAMAVVNDELVTTKATILKKQFENAVALADKALAQLLADGFDSSNAAVQGYFRATAEQRMALGFSELMQKVGNMTDEELQKKIAEMAERASVEDVIPEEDQTDDKA